MEVDRKVPCLGYTDQNCFALCRNCNGRKGPCTADDIRMIIKYLEKNLEQKPS